MKPPREELAIYIDRAREAGLRWLPNAIYHFGPNNITYRLPAPEPGHCTWCGEPVGKGRRTWCSQECVDQFCALRGGSWVDAQIWKRDHGVCAICGINADETRSLFTACRRKTPIPGAEFSRAWWKGGEFSAQWGCWPYPQRHWEADHIVPVVEGGGCCGLENYRTLCVPCHRLETAALAARLAEARRREAGQPEQPDLFA